MDELVKELREYGDIWRDQLLYEAADAIEQLEAAVPKWIPVTERLPEESRMPVLVVDERDVIEGYVNAIGEWMDFHGNRLKMVSHWMPLPMPPKEETE